jgi:hypothetical protein
MMSFPYPTLTEVSQLIEWVKKKIKDRNERTKAERIIKARTDPNLYKFLKEFYCRKFGYEDKVMTVGGHPYPALVFPAPITSVTNIEYPLGELDVSFYAEFSKPLSDAGLTYLDKLENKLKKSDREIQDLVTYVMMNLDENTMKVNCRLGKYKEMLKTCDVLEEELLVEWGEKLPKEDQFEEFWNRHLKLRKDLHHRNPKAFTDGSLRSNALAISTPIIFNDGKTYKMLISERSGRVAVHGDLLHVLPSFMFQPIIGTYSGDRKTEFQIRRHQIEREYLEEVFHYEEAKGITTTPEKFEWYADKPELKYIRFLIDQNDAELLFTGITINLFNLRPEICTLLLIKTRDWYNNHMDEKTITTYDGETLQLKKLEIDTEEFKGPKELLSSKIREKDNELALFVDLGDRLQNSFLERLTPWFTVPPGAGAAKLAVDVARKRLGF